MIYVFALKHLMLSHFNASSIYYLQVDIDFEKEPIGTGKDGKNIFLKDVWPSNEEIAEVTPQELEVFCIRC